MDSFNPNTDDWSAYVERLESFFLANEIKGNKKVAVLLTVLGAKAYSLLRTIYHTRKARREDLSAAARCHEVLRGSQTDSYRGTFPISSSKPE